MASLEIEYVTVSTLGFKVGVEVEVVVVVVVVVSVAWLILFFFFFYSRVLSTLVDGLLE
mgnify:CR=1